MNKINFLKKYILIILLSFLVIILGFTKFYFREDNYIKNQEIEEIDIEEEYNNKENEVNKNEEILKVTEIAEDTTLNSENNEEKPINKELLAEYVLAKTKGDFITFINDLTAEEKASLPTIEQDYCFEYILPYETETFIIEEYLDANVILVESKGDDISKSINDIEKWLKERECIINSHTVVWEK